MPFEGFPFDGVIFDIWIKVTKGNGVLKRGWPVRIEGNELCSMRVTKL
jgi:hypothetical protein